MNCSSISHAAAVIGCCCSRDLHFSHARAPAPLFYIHAFTFHSESVFRTASTVIGSDASARLTAVTDRPRSCICSNSTHPVRTACMRYGLKISASGECQVTAGVFLGLYSVIQHVRSAFSKARWAISSAGVFPVFNVPLAQVGNVMRVLAGLATYF